jgi:hypothetical protein
MPSEPMRRFAMSSFNTGNCSRLVKTAIREQKHQCPQAVTGLYPCREKQGQIRQRTTNRRPP